VTSKCNEDSKFVFEIGTVWGINIGTVWGINIGTVWGININVVVTHQLLVSFFHESYFWYFGGGVGFTGHTSHIVYDFRTETFKTN